MHTGINENLCKFVGFVLVQNVNNEHILCYHFYILQKYFRLVWHCLATRLFRASAKSDDCDDCRNDRFLVCFRCRDDAVAVVGACGNAVS